MLYQYSNPMISLYADLLFEIFPFITGSLHGHNS